ncbi:MAG: AAA family ATPase, partial [Acetobacteraceae bacterium]
MIRQLYVHNFRCLENFTLSLDKAPSVLLVGQNGAGKTTVGFALELFQKIARGTNRVRELLVPGDLTRGQTAVPVRFQVEVELAGKVYTYSVAFELPHGWRELRVAEENLTADGHPVFTRQAAQVRLTRSSSGSESRFQIDWHLVALPIIQPQGPDDPISAFKEWFAGALILRPIPSLAHGNSQSKTLQVDPQVGNFGEWFSGLLTSAPSAYTKIDQFLKQVMPDLQDIQNPIVGKDSNALALRFATALGATQLPFDDLSDGE